ncbi:GlxA family transcriptional regulator [Allonocardiopsis opalescens]|uniref:AraC family transcriptional regulator with amidase-like domain n=1 Tax=Allonocardiopsis opalescens TaxID=1144618 RepID=A0A2T0Q209_9ACTN|nr:GlxA family transcriptional regulator [Allonocardiopsis opalescens]PRX97834.1 AraC family transcriptional regulator with amidase-like domain [Allonocardiopsis opalescens]
MEAKAAPRDVVIVVYDGMQLLDLAGPVEVLDGATNMTGGYRVRIVSLGGREVTSSSGVRVGVDGDLAAVAEPPHTLLVVGGRRYTDGIGDEELLAQLRRLAAGARRVASVCTGAFLLAAAGLLDGRRATTHWASCADLAARYPKVTVEPDAIFVRDGPTVTAAGVTSGTDLALALVEEDHGAEVARTIGRWLVVYLRRPGGQSQFSAWTQVRRTDDATLGALLDHIAANPSADLSVPAMARRTALSERHFARKFTRAVGTTPGRYVERARVEAARALLESGADSVEAVARHCGFGAAETMRRAFLRELGIPPGAYRERFRSAEQQHSRSAEQQHGRSAEQQPRTAVPSH